MKTNRYQWIASGDINAFFGLTLDNVAGLIMALIILQTNFGFPVEFAIRYMVPGTAIGVLVGDVMYFVLAFLLARRTGRSDVTAMPLGLDTPSTIGMVYFVIGPAYANALGETNDPTAAAMSAWHIGIWSIIITGLIKLALSSGSNWAQKYFPRAGLLGSLAAIALGIIAFTQFHNMMKNPIAGFTSLVVVLVALIGRNKLPLKIPGALAAVTVGCFLWHAMRLVDANFETHLLRDGPPSLPSVWLPMEWLTVFRFEWLGAFQQSLSYLPYIIPFAITTVIGGIDCSESAASAGDKYTTSSIISVEAIATIIAGFCGGVIQTTPYIGHPAYKAMGGRAAYTLGTALFVGGAGIVGYFNLMFAWIPEAAILPILVFVGLEITAQSFHATPRRHYAALAFACIPAFAKLIMIYVGGLLGALSDLKFDFSTLPPYIQSTNLFLTVLAGGFIISSLLWSSALAEIIDRRFSKAAIYLGVAAILTSFGVIHSPLQGDKMFWPWQLADESSVRIVSELVCSYILMATMLLFIGRTTKIENPVITSDEEFERLS